MHREQPLSGAVLARVAAGHERVGTFQFARSIDDDEVLRRLADHAIARHRLKAAESESPLPELYASVLGDQAALVAHWMLLGFFHGVMNTDNTSISGARWPGPTRSTFRGTIS